MGNTHMLVISCLRRRACSRKCIRACHFYALHHTHGHISRAQMLVAAQPLISGSLAREITTSEDRSTQSGLVCENLASRARPRRCDSSMDNGHTVGPL